MSQYSSDFEGEPSGLHSEDEDSIKSNYEVPNVNFDSLEFLQHYKDDLKMIIAHRNKFKKFVKQDEINSFSEYLDYDRTACEKELRDGERCGCQVYDTRTCSKEDCYREIKLCRFHCDEDYDPPSSPPLSMTSSTGVRCYKHPPFPCV